MNARRAAGQLTGLSARSVLGHASAASARRLNVPTTTKRMATFASFKIPKVVNEPNHHYAKGSAQRAGLTAAVEKLQNKLPLEVPIVIGGKEVRTKSSHAQTPTTTIPN